MAADFPDFTRGVAVFGAGAGGVTAVDFPDWTDGFVNITGSITPGQDFPDWTKAAAVPAGTYVNPKSITGLGLWLDATQITGQSDGSSLASWPDESGNGYNVAQGTPANQPTYYSSTAGKLVNGKPAVWFSAAAQTQMQTGSAVPLVGSDGSWTCFAVLANGATQTNECSVNWGNPAGTVGWDMIRWLPSGGFEITETLQLTTGKSASSGGGAGTYGIPLVATGIADGTAGTIVSRTNRVAGTTTTGVTSFATGSQTFMVGNGGGQVIWMSGPVCEVIVYPFACSAQQITNSEAYLRSKWGTP